jgi:predicted metal-dependent phosphoesterase TrpH
LSVDLHLHTIHSDGTWTPSQVVAEARRLKFRHIAITDHDTTAGISEAQQAADRTLEVIPGIEINTVLHRENKADLDVHVLGYFIDPESNALKSIIERQQKARMQLVDDAVAKLNSLGIPLTHEIVHECAGEGSIGRPHITRAIVKVGGAADVNEAYKRFMHRESKDYIARHSITPMDAIRAINAAGGIASIAHPGKGDDIGKTILELKEAGLRAVEAYHRSHGLELVKHYLKFAKLNELLITGGSDCHGPSDGYPASIGSLRVPLDALHNLRAAVTVPC